MTDFDKDHYWTYRKLSTAEKKTVRELERKQLIVAVHPSPDWPAKEQGKKRRIAKRVHEQRSLLADLTAFEYRQNHPTRNTPHFTHCYYCQDDSTKDGVCANHWKFLFENMDNRTRMKEKAYHRDMRKQERARKRQEYLDNKQKEGATV